MDLSRKGVTMNCQVAFLAKGFAVSLMDLSFQNWLWGYDASEEAMNVWKEHSREVVA